VRATTALRRLLQGENTVVAPGVYDGLSARLVRRAGFAAV
jgi:2-methylisocitrate lyase-like PEP mutase family enzyme